MSYVAFFKPVLMILKNIYITMTRSVIEIFLQYFSLL